MSTTLLISTNSFSERVDVSSHIADKYLDRHILTAQDRYLRPILGDAFFNQLIDEKETGYWTGSNEAFVTDRVTPFLVWRSYQVYLPHSQIFMTGMGPRVMQEDNSRPLSDAQIQVLTDQARDQAQFFERILIEYLDDNKADFELWAESCDKHRNNHLPRLTSAGKRSREQRLADSYPIYNKEED